MRSSPTYIGSTSSESLSPAIYFQHQVITLAGTVILRRQIDLINKRARCGPGHRKNISPSCRYTDMKSCSFCPKPTIFGPGRRQKNQPVMSIYIHTILLFLPNSRYFCQNRPNILGRAGLKIKHAGIAILLIQLDLIKRRAGLRQKNQPSMSIIYSRNSPVVSAQNPLYLPPFGPKISAKPCCRAAGRA